MESLAEWGYLGLFISSFLAATIIPLSSELVLSILLANNYDLFTTLMVASLGNWLGGVSSFILGRLGNWNFLEKYFRVKKENIYKWKVNIDRWGGLLAFLCWLPIFGDPIAIALGFFRTNTYTVIIIKPIISVLRFTLKSSHTFYISN